MLNDVLAHGLKLVVCGTAAGAISASLGQYYAGPGNKFWNILSEVGITPRRLEPREFRKLLTYGVGLTDVAKGQAGNDVSIDFTRSDPIGLREKILKYRPDVLAFNGKKSAQVFLGQRRVDYGLQFEVVGNTRLFVASSTSGAASKYWNAEIWSTLAELTRR